jgi:prepilin-type N-terminal cleavage/methylation domain-containing protein
MRTLQQKGFTLVEMLITMIMISLLSLMVANFIADWLQTASLAQVRTTLLSNAQDALDNVGNDIRLSGAADQPNRWPDPNGPSGNQYGWTSNSSTLVLARLATNSSNNVIYADTSKYISQKDNVIYYVSNKKLYQRIIAASDANTSATTTCPPALATASCPADRKIAQDVTNFSITYYNADDQVVVANEARAIQLSITLTESQGGKNVSATYATRMVFRNE